MSHGLFNQCLGTLQLHCSNITVTLQLHCRLCRVKKLSDFIKNSLICVPKMNEGLTGLERHEGE